MNRIYLKVSLAMLLAGFSTARGYSQTRSSWEIEVVDKSAGAKSFSSLAIDRLGDFHLIYSNQAYRELRYAFRKKQDKRWDIATVDNMGGLSASLAVDSRGWSHIAYSSDRLPGLYYASWDGKRWQKVLIDPAKTGHHMSIRLDSQDNPRISYYQQEFSDGLIARDLKYAYFDGKSWYIQTVDHRAGTGRWNSIALDGG